MADALKLLLKNLLLIPTQLLLRVQIHKMCFSLQAMMTLEEAKSRAKVANKVALDVEKEKDSDEEEVQRLQQVM